MLVSPVLFLGDLIHSYVLKRLDVSSVWLGVDGVRAKTYYHATKGMSTVSRHPCCPCQP